jgi:hypothetical protein
MNRRKFISLLAPVAVGALIVPELTLPKRTIFLPPSGGWMPRRPDLFGPGRIYLEEKEIGRVVTFETRLDALQPGDLVTLSDGWIGEVRRVHRGIGGGNNTSPLFQYQLATPA